MTSHDSYSLLTLEGYLFHASITHGLTALRAADINQKGTFYSAFFQLSVGIERLMKVILVIDHMAQHSLTPPPDQNLRQHGHDLVLLFDHLRSLSIPVPNPLLRVSRTALPFRLLCFLSDFAKTTRYYNLNSLVAGRPSVDPLSQWHDIINAILAEDVPERQKNRAVERALAMLAPTWDRTVVSGQNLDGTPLTLPDAALLPQVHDLAARHAVFHVLEVIDPLKELLANRVDASYQTARALGVTDCPVPYMIEFLDFFYLDKKLILPKKRWP